MTYIDMATSYLGLFIDPKAVNTFLNTTQSGFAHQLSGTEMSVLLKHLAASLCICIIEITFFCYFRMVFKNIYQPRSHSLPEVERMESLPDEFFGWILPTLRYKTHYFLPMGLDAYFFLRFISILLLFFSTCGMLNLVILLPINYSGSSSSHGAVGMDRLSITNISPSKYRRLNAHFLTGLITIFIFSWGMIYEMGSIVKIRKAYLSSEVYNRRLYSRVLLLGNVSKCMRERKSLERYFEKFSGLEQVWFVDEFEPFWWKCYQANDALNIMELTKVRQLKKLLRSKKTSKEITKQYFFAPIYLPVLRVPGLQRFITIRLPGFLRVLAFQKQIEVDAWAIKLLDNVQKCIMNRRVELSEENFSKRSQVFLKFRSQEAAHMAFQVLLSPEIGHLDRCLVDVNPDDILWWNLSRRDNLITALQRYSLSLIFLILCVIYVVPVSFVTLLAQTPNIARLIPFLCWIENLPQNVREILSTILPSLLLSLLTEIQLRVFRKLTYLKGMWTGSEVEMDLQRWYFAFLFIQQFLVVSILSSVLAVMVQIIDKPTSIPILLASNLPKSATFFFEYLPVKAFAICGGSFLRLDELLLKTFIYLWLDVTPRQKLKRKRSLLRIKWGTIYPSISVYGSIGITYCVISPLISIFMIVILALILLCYKYSLHYIYDHLNPSETYGRLYPKALYQLYTGIYCLEFCLIGVCFSQRDETGLCPMKFQGLTLVAVFFMTVIGNVYVYNRYKRYMELLPLICDGVVEPVKTDDEQWLATERGAYYHPCYKYDKPQIWLPRDKFGYADTMLQAISNLPGAELALAGASTDGAKLIVQKHWIVTKVHDWPQAK